MSHVFISYSKTDIGFARHLRRLLENRGFGVWMDETELVPSSQWWPEIEHNIETCAAFLVIMSPGARGSRWVEREILYAEDQNKPIFPILLEGKSWPRLADIQYSDMTAGIEAALPASLTEGLAKRVPVGDRQTVPPPLPGPIIAPRENYGSRRTAPPSRSPRRQYWVVGTLIALLVVSLAIPLWNDVLRPSQSSNTPDLDATESALADLRVTQTVAVGNSPSPAATLIPAPTTTDTPELVASATAAQVATDGTPTAPAATRIPREIAEASGPHLGPEDAPVVIVEFADYQCRYCARFYEQTLYRLLEKYPDELRFVHRDFPIFGEDSLRAAEAAQCANEQGKFWEMHDRLFEHTVDQETTAFSHDVLVGYAQQLGLDRASFDDCLSSERYAAEIQADYDTAVSLIMHGTPTFVINGVVYAFGAQPFEVFDAVVSELLQ
jgi:protein-disulfide isomerase